MASKPVKLPFYRVTAECPKCGPVTVERKPHPKAGQRTESGAIQQPQPLGIVCSCGYHAKVTSAKLITKRTPV